MSEISADGFRWDTGPSVITMRPIFEDLFAAAGRKLADYLTLLPVEPLTRYFYPDGVIFDATRDLARMTEQIAAFGSAILQIGASSSAEIKWSSGTATASAPTIAK